VKEIADVLQPALLVLVKATGDVPGDAARGDRHGFLSLPPSRPQGGISAGVEAGNDHDRLINQSIKETVWEPVDQGPAGFATYRGVGSRHLQHGFRGRSNLFEEFLSEALSLSFVPNVPS
jgi:hypothetical protein